MDKNSFFYPYAFSLFQTNLNSLKNELRAVPIESPILLWSLERVKEEELLAIIDDIFSLGLNNKIYWWLQPSHLYSRNVHNKLGEYLHQIDIDLLLLYLQINVCKSSKPSQQWNPSTRKFLFPTGKPAKPNRIRLLYKFYQQGLLDFCNWSLFVNEFNKNNCHKLLPELSNAEFETFISDHVRSLDLVSLFNSGAADNHTNGYPFDGKTYANSSFRVISETQMLSAPIITEKTWITIINRHPFLLIAYPHNLKYLKDTGYKTFDSYLPIPDYDTIEDQEQRLDAVVKNTKFWVDNIELQQNSIQQDVEHNYQLLLNQMNITVSQATQLATLLGKTVKSPFSIVPLSLEQFNWTSFYYNIKDPRWPDCFLEDSFNDLPAHVKDECINIFGYKPKKIY